MIYKSTKKWIYNNSIDISDTNEILKYLLLKRDVVEKDKFLNPELSDIPNFGKLYNSSKAAKQIVKAVKDGKKIFIHGDFDTDGVCATAILWEYLYKELSKTLNSDIDVKPYIPSRVDEGYGLSESSIEAMLSDGAQMIITVDCGIRDKDIIEKYIKQGLETIVTDHHEPPKEFKTPKYTIVHPMYPEHEYPYQKVCGSTVSYLLTNAIRNEVGENFEISEDSKGLDLVALATVTDLMPLIDVNRIFVKYGLEQMSKNPRLGIKHLLSLAQVKTETLESYHLGFVIGPRLNAAGRIGHAMDALRLVLAPNEKAALEYSSQLHNLNLKRQDNTQEILSYVYSKLPEFENDKLIFLIGDNWHEGIIGLVASKVFDRTGKPTIVATKTEKEIKASARSIPDFNITNALDIHSEYLMKYGGHSQAAGMTIKDDKVDEFNKKITEYANEKITNEQLTLGIEIDLKLGLKDLSYELYKTLDMLKPYGYGNSKPLVEIDDVVINKKYNMSNGKHTKLTISQGEFQTNILFFNSEDDINELNEGDSMSVIGYLSLNTWNDNINVEIQGKGFKQD